MSHCRFRIVVVEGEGTVRRSIGAALRKEGCEVDAARSPAEARKTIDRVRPAAVLIDLDTGEKPSLELVKEIAGGKIVVLLIASEEAAAAAAEGVKMGAVRWFPKPVDVKQILRVLPDLVAEYEIRHGAKRSEPIVVGNRETDRFILGSDPKMKEVFRVVNKLAASPGSTVLIEGESGVGKEMIAKAIHYNTSASRGRFVEINCGSLPSNLLESELFGHEMGAFTDAKTMKKGLVEIASGGTLFLDEIGEMPIELQATLLRVIETKRFKRVGGVSDIEVDLRFIAATNQDLKQAVSQKRFRNDLYYRLNVVPIHLPPLRERLEDIPILATFFIDYFNRELSRNIRGLSPSARNRLQEYDWPGNVRELKNVIERAILLESDDLILLEHLPLEISTGLSEGVMGELAEEEDEFVPITLSEAERRQILKTVDWARGNKTKAARTLGISRQTLREKLKQYEAS